MGRAEKRAEAKRKKQLCKNDGVRYMRRNVRAVRDNTRTEAIDFYLVNTLYVLHEKFGFGKKRLERFTSELVEASECIQGKYVTREDMLEVLVKEVGLALDE